MAKRSYNREEVERIMRRLRVMWQAWLKDSPETKRAFYQIGTRLTTQAKLNARRLRIVDTGRLINSIAFRPNDGQSYPGILFGVFGVGYAKFHEFGASWTERNRRAMFYFMRKTGQNTAKKSKNVVRGGRLTARPFLRPAINDNKDFIIDQLRMIGRGDK